MGKASTLIQNFPRSGLEDVLIDANHIAANTITATELASGAVTSAALGAAAVTTAALASGAVTVAKLEANLQNLRYQVVQGTITTSTGGEVLFGVPLAGTIQSISFVAKDALTKNDTNNLSFGVANKTQSLTVVDSTAAANTTKATGGSSLTAYGSFATTLTANTTVAAGDLLALSATVTGTLANQVTEGFWYITILPS